MQLCLQFGFLPVACVTLGEPLMKAERSLFHLYNNDNYVAELLWAFNEIVWMNLLYVFKIST